MDILIQKWLIFIEVMPKMKLYQLLSSVPVSLLIPIEIQVSEFLKLIKRLWFQWIIINIDWISIKQTKKQQLDHSNLIKFIVSMKNTMLSLFNLKILKDLQKDFWLMMNLLKDLISILIQEILNPKTFESARNLYCEVKSSHDDERSICNTGSIGKESIETRIVTMA